MNNLMVFENQEVEVLVLEGKVLFNAKQVGDILGMGESTIRMAIAKMSDKQIVKLTNSIVKDIDFRKLHNTGENFLTESGVYKLIMRSNKPETERFQDWVTDEVLPSIRLSGGYVTQGRAIDFVNLWIPSLDDTSKTVIAGLIESTHQLKAEIKEKDQKLLEVTPKADFYDAVTPAKTTFSIREAANILNLKGIGQKKLFEILRAKNILGTSGESYNVPYREYFDRGLFELDQPKPYKRGDRLEIATKTVVTIKGLEFISNILKGHIENGNEQFMFGVN